jgi:hypothetical protein
VWLGTDQGLYRVDGSTSQLIGDRNLNVYGIQNINSQVWLRTDRGLYRIDGDIAKLIGDRNLNVYGIQNINSQVWLRTTDRGLYRVDGDTPKPIGDRHLEVIKIQNINGQVWLGTENGAYRVDEDVTIAVDLDSKGFWSQLINTISPWKVWVSPVIPKPCYTRIANIAGKPDPSSTRCGSDPYDKAFRRDFELIMATDKNEFDKAVKQERYNRTIREQNISNGLQTV